VPDFAQCPHLETICFHTYEMVPDFKLDWDQLQHLQELYIDIWSQNDGKSNGNGLHFNALSQLKILYISNLTFAAGEPFLGFMPKLESLILAGIEIAQLSDDWFGSPHLTNCSLSVYPALLPKAFLENTTITTLTLYRNDHVFVPYRMLQAKQLKSLSCHFPRYQPVPNWNLPSSRDFLTLFEELSEAQKIGIYALLIEGLDTVQDWESFKTHFFELLHANNVVWRELVAAHLHLLNADQKPFEFPKTPALYRGKSIAFLGTIRKTATHYKEKLTSLNIDYHSNVQSNTEWIVLGQGKKINLPTDFWNYPHAFLREETVELFLTEATPEFLQVPEFDVLEPLQALLWSGDATNDALVVEMLKSGGVPLPLLSDVVLVASVCEDVAVRKAFRDLVKPLLPLPAHKLFMRRFDTRRVDEFRKFAMDVPHFNLAEMLHCFQQRDSGYHWTHPWNMPELMTSRHRAKLFESFYQLNHDTKKLDLNHLYISEVDKIALLSRPFEHLKELHIRVERDAFLQV
jgi:hypothetical protein